MSIIPESPATVTSLTSPLIGGTMVTDEKVRQFNMKIIHGKVDHVLEVNRESPVKYLSESSQGVLGKIF